MTNALLRQRFLEASQSLSAKGGALLRDWWQAGRAAVHDATQSLVDRWRRMEVEDEIGIALLAYVTILFGLLLLVHFMHPEGPPTSGSSRSPIHVLQRPAK